MTYPLTFSEWLDLKHYRMQELKVLERQRMKLNTLRAWSDAVCVDADWLDKRIQWLREEIQSISEGLEL